jgi:hypothetical protein
MADGRVGLPFDTNLVEVEDGPRKGKITSWWADALQRLSYDISTISTSGTGDSTAVSVNGTVVEY